MDKKRWQKLSLAEQLGNIASEISRARHWDKMKDYKSRKMALERALELIDLTLTDSRWKNRLKEITRLREVVCDLLIKSKIYKIPLKMLENFCLNFALVARKKL